MDKELRERHLANVSDINAIELYDRLCAEYEKQYGPIGEGAQHIVGDIAVMEQMKRQLNADIAKRGVTERFKNGRQEFWRENKSIQAARALVDQQRRQLSELKLTPASQKYNLEAAEDDFNTF